MVTKSRRYLLENYGVLRENNPKLAEAIEGVLEEHKKYFGELRKIKSERKEIFSILAHEFSRPLTLVLGYVGMLNGGRIKDPEKLKEIYKNLNVNSQLLRDYAALIHLPGLNADNLMKFSEKVDLESVLRKHAIMYEEDILKENIEFKLKYDREEHNSINVYTHKGAINALFGTLIGNSVSWAPPESRITGGLRITSEDFLEFMLENRYGGKKERNIHGNGSGVGYKFVKSMVHELEGSLINYEDNRIPKDYEVQERFGGKSKNQENGNIFGVRLVIPMNKLRKLNFFRE